MSDGIDFDFDFEDDAPQVDTAEQMPNTEEAITTAAPKKRSGKQSGKATGSKTRQQKRIPMHERNPLVTQQRKGFVRRVVNDVPGRVERLKLAGWTPVEGESIGDRYAGQAAPVGSVVSKPVGRGTNGILMEIPEEFYKEDQAAKQRRVDESEQMMIDDAVKAAGGEKSFQGKIELGN